MTQATGGSKPAFSARRQGQGDLLTTQSQSPADAKLKTLLESIIADTSDEELKEYLKAINPEDAKKISRLLVEYAPVAERVARELTIRSDENTTIRNASERLRHLRGDIPPRKWIILVVTWRFAPRAAWSQRLQFQEPCRRLTAR